MPVKHAFVSAKSDGADSTLVRPSNWNANHNGPTTALWSWTAQSTGQTMTNIPVALTEFFNSAGVTYIAQRTVADMRYVAEARISVQLRTAANAGSTLVAQYSVDSGINWAYLDGSAGPSVSLASTNLTVGAWVNVTAAAQVESCWLRICTLGGDGAADPVFGMIRLEGR